jgi:hypothetical protein
MCIIYFTITLATDYQTFGGRAHMPFAMWTIDTIDLFIHEAGHLIFRIFGQMIYFMGGSMFQVILPIVTAVVFARTSLHSLMFTLYWIGQSMVNVSIYIGDAPDQKLPLISHAVLHDWHWILGHADMMDSAGDIASVVNILGIICCCAGIGLGLWFTGYDGYRFFIKDRNSQ